VVFNVGRTDAEYTAKELGRIDPLQVKHEITDEYAVEKTHPIFYNLAEQWQDFTGIYRIYRLDTLPSSSVDKQSKPAKPAIYLSPGLIPRNS
jgi:hypothetical protein